MKKNLLFLLILQSVLTPLNSQALNKITGKVIDDRSRPYAGATVHILNSNFISVTDSSGLFEFTLPLNGKYRIETSAVGFSDVIQDVKTNTAPIEITLTPESVRLDEVIVSAQKKEDILMQLPLSISVFSSKQTEQYRLWNLRELSALVPNLISANPGDERNVTSIRGITSTSYDPAVTTYFDGINQFTLDSYIPELFDIERIEILRGPQGTLYGRNAMGGVINIITKSPQNTFTSFAEVSAGNYGSQRYSAGIKSPIIKNKAFMGAALLYDARQGFYKNEFDGSHFDAKHSITGNYYLTYHATPAFTFSINIKHHANRNKGAFPIVAGVDEALQNPYRLTQNAVARMVDNTINYSFTGKYSGNKVNLVSQTAYQENYRYYDAPLDADFSSLDGITIINNYGRGKNNVKAWTQEFRLTPSAKLNRKWDWIGGVYLFNQYTDNKQATHFGENADLLGLPDKNFSILNSIHSRNYGIAVFGQATHTLFQNLDVTIGLRYDYEYKQQRILGEYLKDPDPVPQFETTPDTSAHTNFTSFSPRISFTYTILGNILCYAGYSRGFRTGGFTQLSADPSQSPLFQFKPEYSNNYEAGFKSGFLDNRLLLNIAVFNTVINNAQIPSLVLPAALTITKNAGKLNSKGIELELHTKMVKHLEVEYNFGYTHSRYKVLKLPKNGTEEDFSGNRQIFSPSFTSMMASQYTFILKSKLPLQLSLRGEWLALGCHYFDLANTIKQPGYSLFNTLISIKRKKTTLTFWTRNITGKKYILYAYDFGGIHLGNPRVFGVTLKWKFGNATNALNH